MNKKSIDDTIKEQVDHYVTALEEALEKRNAEIVEVRGELENWLSECDDKDKKIEKLIKSNETLKKDLKTIKDAENKTRNEVERVGKYLSGRYKVSGLRPEELEKLMKEQPNDYRKRD